MTAGTQKMPAFEGTDGDDTFHGDAFHFNAGRPFFASAGDLNVTTNLLGTLIEGDVKGDGVSDVRLLVVGNYTLKASDFIL